MENYLRVWNFYVIASRQEGEKISVRLGVMFGADEYK